MTKTPPHPLIKRDFAQEDRHSTNGALPARLASRVTPISLPPGFTPHASLTFVFNLKRFYHLKGPAKWRLLVLPAPIARRLGWWGQIWAL